MQRLKGITEFRKKNKVEKGYCFINPQRQAVKHFLESNGMSNREFKKANKKLVNKVGKKYVLENGELILKGV